MTEESQRNEYDESIEEKYSLTRARDIQRDGMYVEVCRRSDNKVLIEIFYSDLKEDFVFNSFAKDLPLDLVEWSIDKAKRCLLPSTE